VFFSEHKRFLPNFNAPDVHSIARVQVPSVLCYVCTKFEVSYGFPMSSKS